MSDTHAQSVAFVRDTAIPASPPPNTQAGAVNWVRANLFSTWANAALTIAAIYIIYVVFIAIWPWLTNGVWTAPSLTACREVLQGEVGACFSVLTERWNQLLFGFKYPNDQYWRPGIAFLLLFAAIAPVMFFKLPRKLLIITALYPFVAYYLIWGGTILTPILALVGFIAGYFAYARLVKGNFAAGFFAGIAAAALVWWLGGYLVEWLASPTPWLEEVPSRDMGGFMLNLILGVTCVSLSIPLGIVLALGRQSKLPLIKGV